LRTSASAKNAADFCLSSAVTAAAGGSFATPAANTLAPQPASASGRGWEQKLVENIRAFVDAVAKAKPAGAKGTYVKKVSLSSSQGVGVKVDTSSVGIAGTG
jgi:large subunit ribosomal protein L1